LRLVVATRGSRLSLEQTRIAMGHISRLLGGLEWEPLIVRTKGDIVRDKPLYEIGVKGIFEKEVNKAVLEGRADLAVHSMKDLPSEIDDELEIVYVPPRGPQNDVLVVRGLRVARIEDLPGGSRVGTSSVRRRALILYYNREVEVAPIRGNVDTRLGKLERGEYDAIVLAEAGISRLGARVDYTRLSLDYFPPAPGQGMIAVVARRDNPLSRRLKSLIDPETRAMMEAERSFLRHAEIGCHTAVGATSWVSNGNLFFVAAVLDPEGRGGYWVKMRGDPGKASEVGRRAGLKVRSLT